MVKQEAGVSLLVSSYKKMEHAWGQYSPWALQVFRNAVAPTDVMRYDEVSMITLADRINVNSFRACQRPELDWSAVPDEKIYEFVVWHEIGHRRDNFDMLDFMMNPKHSAMDNADPKRYWYRAMRRVNEVLADRFAWNKLFPGQSMPIASGRTPEYLEKINEDITQLARDFKRGRFPLRPLPPGHAEYIPREMLENRRLASYTGLAYRAPRLSSSGFKDYAALNRDFELAKIGPKRPELQLGEGRDCGLFFAVDYQEPARLLIGRNAGDMYLKAVASQYGFAFSDLVAFRNGGEAQPTSIGRHANV